MRPRPHTIRLLALVAAVACAAGCGASVDAPSKSPSPSVSPSVSPSGSTSTAQLSGQITVLAAASLTGTFQSLAEEFEAANPETSVVLSFGGSSALATQIIDGGVPADVFASASTTNMDAVVEAGDALAPVVFARNRLTIVVPPGNPAGITSLADLARPGVTVALCQPQVPCGVVSDQVLGQAGLTVVPVTLEPDVKSTLTKVELGEVDAGLVYVTDALAAGAAVQAIEIPADVNASTTYPIAVLRGSAHPDVAQALIDAVLSAAGTRTLLAAGFAAP